MIVITLNFYNKNQQLLAQEVCCDPPLQNSRVKYYVHYQLDRNELKEKKNYVSDAFAELSTNVCKLLSFKIGTLL